MSYTPQTWIDNNVSFPPSAARFSVMEDGIYRAHGQVVTVLPTSTIFDGMEVRVRVPATAVGFEAWWTFSWDSSNPTQQPWAFIGGSAAGAQTDATFSTSSTTFVADSVNGPRVTVPFKGIYRVDYGFRGVNNTAGAASLASLAYGAAAVSTDEVQHAMVGGLTNYDVARSRAIVVTSANQLIEMQYGVTTGTGQFSFRWMMVTPIRVSS